jgi:MFS transporter, TsgA protein
MKNKLALTFIALLANFILAGFATQFGMLIEPIATAYSVNVTDAAFAFSLLNCGALAGTLLAFFLIDKLGIKLIIIFSFITIILSVFCIYLLPFLIILFIAVTLIGFSGGLGICLAGTIIVSIWNNKEQNCLLISQDVVFNIAGIAFPIFTTFLLLKKISWSYSFIAISCFAIISLAITIFTNFSTCNENQTQANNSKNNNENETEWNSGIIGGGICLFIAMLALYTFLTWAPLFVKEKFGVPFEQAGQIITRYWAAALLGSLISAIIVSKIQIKYFILAIMSLASILTAILITTHNYRIMPYLTYGYGFVGAAVYNTFIAFGVSFAKKASSKHISYILIMGSCGAMFSPAISALLKNALGLQAIMYCIPMFYLIIAAVILILVIKKTIIKE